jgi:pseudo-rSAM protein
MIDTQYKFYIHPFVYFSKADDKILLYNTNTGEYIENSFPICKQLITDIYEPKNLGIIDLVAKYLEDTDAIEFINEIIEKDFGKRIEVKPNMPKLINLLPILNLQDDIDRLREDEEHNVGEKSLQYLNELNIYLNNVCHLNCLYCDLYSKQIKSCNKEKNNTYIQADKIKEILDSLEYAPLKRVNFLGGNIFDYPFLKELTESIKGYDFDFHYWVHIKNLRNIDLEIDSHKDILIDFPIDIELVKQSIKNYKENKKVIYHFLIENDSQYEETNAIIKATEIANYQIVPVYTGANISFFENNIYLEKKDIFASPISHRIIFCNQKLNSNHFGKLYVLADGSVKANMNTSTLGNIYKNSLLDIISTELNQNTAWRVIRNETPCNQCLYQYLCPPPSNYEVAIGKPNLCHVSS